MPADPPRDQQGKIIPHDHAEILDGHHLIRHTTPHDLYQNQVTQEMQIGSGAYSESSEGGMSVDIEEWMTSDGLDPLHYVTNPDHGAVRISVGELRKLGFQVGWDPDSHPYHAEVWGIGNGSKKRRKVKALAVKIKKAAGES
jgi:hypothetical protein